MIKKAYQFAQDSHKDQKRESGEEFFEHPIEVSKILMTLKAGSATITAALLHDVVEDSTVTIKQITDEFGEEVASIVDGLTKIDKVHFENKEDYTAENIRKILLATTKDIRIMLIKLADRLHNMRTLSSLRPSKQKRIAKETLEIYAPIAHKLGMWWIKGELEDLSLRYLEPEVYYFLRDKINEKREEREKKTLEIIKSIQAELQKKGVNAVVTGRAKYFNSIYKKMKKKNLDFDEIYDLIAVRIIAKSIQDCYSALGAVHEMWQPVPRKFKDYIANPKMNHYQSLHTVLKGPYDKLIEVQIRTEEMHYFAEDGVAAHWRYHGTERDKRFDRKISWLKQLLEWRASSDDAHEFIDTLKLDLFENEIIVFTPKGDPITLEENSTPVDFAYEVHTGLGERCSKALVNGKMVPLNHRLKPGDVVEILTSKDAKPSRQWINFVQTPKAKSKIRSALKIHTDVDTRKKAKQEYWMKSLADEIEVEDNKTYPIKISKCCNPDKKRDIVGFLTKDKKLTIHAKDCPNIHALEPNKEVKVKWKETESHTTSRVMVTVEDVTGILIDTLNYFVDKGFNVFNINSKQTKEKSFTIIVEIKDADQDKLKEAVQQLRSHEPVINVAIF